MGDLLRVKIFTAEQAKQKLDEEIAEAHARYERRLKQIAEDRTEFTQPTDKLGTRAYNTVRFLIGEREPDPRWPHRWIFRDVPVTPEAVSKLTARQILAEPNSGHKTVREVAAWLKFHGYELAL